MILKAVLVAVAAVVLIALSSLSGATPSRSSTSPYDILDVPMNADKDTITQAYRALAKKWHPDRNKGSKDAEAVFKTIAWARDVLADSEKRDVYNRLGIGGLKRLQDGDPRVQKDWVPPDEVLRRIHNDGEQYWVDAVITSSFASISALLHTVAPAMRWLAGGSEHPSVVITAATASGQSLGSGDRTSEDVTFKLALSGKSFDFTEDDVTHNCARSKFLGMKTTFYLQCFHTPGLTITVSVAASTFTVTNRELTNRESEPFLLTME